MMGTIYKEDDIFRNQLNREVRRKQQEEEHLRQNSIDAEFEVIEKPKLIEDGQHL